MRQYLLTPALLAAAIAAVGCAPTPYYAHDRGYPDRGYQDRYDRNVCSNCGRISDIERVALRGGSGSTSGGGAVLGAIIGGVLGSTVGKGDGRRAATVAGAVAGGFAGNAIEREGSRDGRDLAWLITIDLDDGRWAEVTQYEVSELRRGDRVQIRNDRVYRIR